MATMGLESVHPELLDMIVSQLEHADYASLLLSSRTMRERALQAHDPPLFTSVNVNLSVESLQTFVEMTQPGQPGQLLRDCTITGLATRSAHKGPVDDPAELTRLLVKAFRNLKQISSRHALRSLTLSVSSRDRDEHGRLVPSTGTLSWQAVWQTALDTFRISIAALTEAQLCVSEQLSLFSEIKSCSLDLDAFCSLPTMIQDTAVFGSLKKLAISVSTQFAWYHSSTPASISDLDLLRQQYTNPGDQMHMADSRVQTHLPSIMSVTMSLPGLSELDIHWYNRKKVSLARPSIVPYRLSPSDEYVHGLQRLTVRGLSVEKDAFLQLLVNARPQHLVLIEVNLLGGTWDSVFQFITKPDSLIKSIHLDDIWQYSESSASQKLLAFKAPGMPKFLHFGDDGPSTLTRRGNSVKDRIESFFSGDPAGTRELYEWILKRKENYGLFPLDEE